MRCIKKRITTALLPIRSSLRSTASQRNSAPRKGVPFTAQSGTRSHVQTGRLDESHAHGFDGGGRAVCRIEFFHRIFDVKIDGALAYAKYLPGAPRRLPERSPAQAFLLPLGQPFTA